MATSSMIRQFGKPRLAQTLCISQSSYLGAHQAGFESIGLDFPDGSLRRSTRIPPLLRYLRKIERYFRSLALNMPRHIERC